MVCRGLWLFLAYQWPRLGNLETYGVLTGIEAEDQPHGLGDVLPDLLADARQSPVLFFAQTGLDALKGRTSSARPWITTSR